MQLEKQFIKRLSFQVHLWAYWHEGDISLCKTKVSIYQFQLIRRQTTYCLGQFKKRQLEPKQVYYRWTTEHEQIQKQQGFLFTRQW